MRRIGAVTVHQPWAELIARGRKRTENRFYLPGLSIGDFIAVHAGKWQPRGTGLDYWLATSHFYEERRDDLGVSPALEGFCNINIVDRHGAPGERYATSAVPYGAVVAVAVYRGMVRAPLTVAWRPDPWYEGPCGWLLGDVVALASPVPCRGNQKLWEMAPDVLAAVRAEYKASTAVHHRRRALIPGA